MIVVLQPADWLSIVPPVTIVYPTWSLVRRRSQPESTIWLVDGHLSRECPKAAVYDKKEKAEKGLEISQDTRDIS
jgi:hypothetical protein